MKRKKRLEPDEVFWLAVRELEKGQIQKSEARRRILADEVIRRFTPALAMRLCTNATRRPGNRLDVAILLSFMSRAIFNRGKYACSEVIDEWLGPELEGLGEGTWAAEVTMRRYDACQFLGKTHELVQIRSQAVLMLEGSGLTPGEGEDRMAVGSAHMQARRFHEGHNELATASLVFHVFGYDFKRALTLIDLAEAQIFLNDYWSAYRSSVIAELIFRERHKPIELRGRCRIVRGEALVRLGRPAMGIKHFEIAQIIYERVGDVKEELRCMLSKAVAMTAIGHHEKAQVIFNILKKAGPSQFLVNALNNGGNNCQELRKWDAAVSCYDQAIDACHALGRFPDLLASARMNRAGALRFLGRLEEALAELKDVAAFFEESRLDGQLMTAQLLQIDVLSRLSRFDEAFELVTALKQVDLGLEWNVRYHHWIADNDRERGNLAEAKRKYELALEMLGEVIATGVADESNVEFVEKRIRLVRDAMKCALDCGDALAAWNALQVAKGVLLRNELSYSRSTLGMNLSQEVIDARSALCEWLKSEMYASFERKCAEQGIDAESNLDDDTSESVPSVNSQIQSETAKRFGEYLAMATWGRRRRRSKRRRWAGPTARLRAIQDALPAGWGVLDLAIRANELLPFVITKDRLSMEPVGVEWKSDLVVRHLTDAKQWQNWGRMSRDHFLDYFYDTVVTAIKPQLAGLNGLYIVPHLNLTMIPFHALKGHDGTIWGEEIEIAYLPCAELVTTLPPPNCSGAVVSAVNSQRHSDGTLPFAEWEAMELAKSVETGCHRLMVGDGVTLNGLADWTDAGIVHFATHGYGYAPLALLSRLQLSNGVLLADDVIRWMPGLRTGCGVIVNCCESGWSDARSMDNGIGLVQAFLARGASMVLSAQWAVTDVAAAVFVVEFCRQLLVHSCSFGQALSSAVNKVRKTSAEEIVNHCRELKSEKFRKNENPHEWNRVDEIEAQMASLSARECPFEHPIHWAAFRVNGRVH